MSDHKTNQQYGTIDLVKFMCAILIVIAHFITENAEGKVNTLFEYSVSLYIIVVPFFFSCSSYFLFKKIFENQQNGKKIVIAYCKRLLIIYLSWSVIYLSFKIATWIRFSVDENVVIKYLINSVFYSTYKTIWFLPALCIGVFLTYLLINQLSFRKVMMIAGIFYIIGMLGVSYRFISEKIEVLDKMLENYDYIFVSTRNGLFNAFPFVVLGAFIAKKKETEEGNFWLEFIFTIIFAIAFVLEAFIIKMWFSAPNANTLIMLVPFIYFFIRICLKIKMRSSKYLLWMRKMSTAVFLCQRLFLTAIPELFPESLFANLLHGNPYFGLFMVLLFVISLSTLLTFLSSKSRILDIFC